MEIFHVTISGAAPDGSSMLMHADNIEWADRMEDWKNDPGNKAKSKAGDDRTPPWRWIGCLNSDDHLNGVVTVPSEYTMRCIMGGAAQVPTGKGKKTFKAQSQSGLFCKDFHWPLTVNSKAIKMADINKLFALKTFKEHQEAARNLGFSLFMKRVAINGKKHVRVRPMFTDWMIEGDIIGRDEQITKGILQTILDICGRTQGLGDWRPGAKTPGPWGMFTAAVEL